MKERYNKQVWQVRREMGTSNEPERPTTQKAPGEQSREGATNGYGRSEKKREPVPMLKNTQETNDPPQ